ncbi:YggT family protein [Candidatus Gracilibacteria bacterium]|nr:YggT family protein [Candidatus Gracilibacteria bacterium]
MTTFLIALVIFLEILEYIVIFDVILSWLMLLGINFRPKFVANILNPIYSGVRKYIPSRFGVFDFTPIIVILALVFLKGIIYMYFPEVGIQIAQLKG